MHVETLRECGAVKTTVCRILSCQLGTEKLKPRRTRSPFSSKLSVLSCSLNFSKEFIKKVFERVFKKLFKRLSGTTEDVSHAGPRAGPHHRTPVSSTGSVRIADGAGAAGAEREEAPRRVERPDGRERGLDERASAGAARRESHTVVHHPQGFGLGNSGVTAVRTHVTPKAGESTYTELGVELGLLGAPRLRRVVARAAARTLVRGPGSARRSRRCSSWACRRT